MIMTLHYAPVPNTTSSTYSKTTKQRRRPRRTPALDSRGVLLLFGDLHGPAGSICTLNGITSIRQSIRSISIDKDKDVDEEENGYNTQPSVKPLSGWRPKGQGKLGENVILKGWYISEEHDVGEEKERENGEEEGYREGGERKRAATGVWSDF